MANVTVSVPDALVPRLLAALRNKYPDDTAGLTNVQTMKMGIRLDLKRDLVDYEIQQATSAVSDDWIAARDNARTQASTDADAIT